MAISFKQHNAANQGTVMIVDALNLAFRWMHKKQFDFEEEYIRTVESLKKSYKAEQVIIACDLGSSTFRKAIHPGYKGARKEKYDLQTETERLEFELFFKEFNKVIENFQETTNYPVFRFKGVEADDIAAYIVKNKSKYEFNTIWLMSSDNDWNLLVDPATYKFSYVTRKEITYDNWNDNYEYTQEEYVSIKCLQGDPGDSVPGVPGVGPKRALELVKKYGNALDLAEALPLPGKQKFIQNLNEFGKEGILKNYQLMDLLTFCEDALGPENCKTIDSVLLSSKA